MRYREQTDDDEGESAVLDMSIVGDEEEQHRIELEQNLQDLSIPLSLSNPSHASDSEYSEERRSGQHKHSESSFELEYPRHNPRPQDVSAFQAHNFSFLDNTQLDRDFDPSCHAYRSADDEADVHYVGNTLSTAAHHASAVTLSAGLDGRGGKRAYAGEASLSGAEYDPDRPLETLLNGVADDLSMLNMDNTLRRAKRRSRDASFAHGQVTFDSIVVGQDTSAIGGTKHNSTKTRGPKQVQDHAKSFHYDPERTQTTKTRVKQPALNIRPSTPSTGANATAGSNATNGSRFTRLAKTLAREIEASQRWADVPVVENKLKGRPARKAQSTHRSPFRDVINRSLSLDTAPNLHKTKSCPTRTVGKNSDKRLDDLSRHDHSQSKGVVLPDITGLTSVVASPPRKEQRWRRYSGDGEKERVEVELLKVLTSLQTRLNQLESQNLVSRRRVRELELELENCKVDVKRERTRVLEREQIIVSQQKDFQRWRDARSKPERAAPDSALERRYNEIVQEKKALEALITTLRTHLARLTNELSNHQSQLDDLRSLRESDLRNLQSKIAEVEALKFEIERLGGEVEILRGVVEEGLNERRKARETMHAANNSVSPVFETAGASDEENQSRLDRDDVTNERLQADFPSPPPSRPQSRQNVHPTYSKIPSNHSLAGASRPNAPGKENEHSSAEAEDQHSERSESHHSQDFNVSRMRRMQANVRRDTRHARFAREKVSEDDRACRVRSEDGGMSRPSRGNSGSSAKHTVNYVAEGETPFPQIRGEHLERLFFSAPEHNEKTCRVCHRHRRPGASDDELDFPSWLPPRKRVKTGREDDRSRYGNIKMGDTEGLDEHLSTGPPKVTNRAPFSDDKLPPQTVLARVLRELEDDFTHYKGIYIELADQYKLMDSASNVPKRNVLAEHLKEVINTLEQKGDQIASLYDLLTVKDKPVAESVVPERKHASRAPVSPRSRRPAAARRHGGLRKYATHA